MSDIRCDLPPSEGDSYYKNRSDRDTSSLALPWPAVAFRGSDFVALRSSRGGKSRFLVLNRAVFRLDFSRSLAVPEMLRMTSGKPRKRFVYHFEDFVNGIPFQI